MIFLALSAFAKDPVLNPPDLGDPKVKLEIQLEVVRGMVDAKLDAAALQAIKELREQGVSAEELDVLQARALYGQGMLFEARTQMDGYLAKHKKDASAWAFRGVMYADEQRLDDAEKALSRALRLKPNAASVLNNLGYVQLADKRVDEAVATFRRAIAIDPTSKRARNNLGFALARLERDDEALAAFRGAGDESDARYNLGLACELREDLTSAITNYRAALTARPTHAEAQSALARLVTEAKP